MRSGQTVRNRRHNRRYVWLGWVLSSLFAPIDQFVVQVVGQLTSQPRNLATTLGFRAVACGTGGNVGFGDTGLEYLFAGNAFDEWEQLAGVTQQLESTVTVLNIGRMDDDV